MIKTEGSKETLDRKRLFFVGVFLISLGTLVLVVFKSKKDESVMVQSSEPIILDGNSEKKGGGKVSEKVEKLLNSSLKTKTTVPVKKKAKYRRKVLRKIKYKAPQVILREGHDGFSKKIPLGANLVGKLLTGIDTRETGQRYKVLLPYGGRGKGDGELPKNTLLFGKIQYSNQDKKVFIHFSKALFPNGEEMKIKAQALNSKDFSPGLTGIFHGKRTERIVSTLGLSMVSAMTDTLTEREAVVGLSPGTPNAASRPNPKATMKNALYQGISKVSQMEAQRQGAELASQKEYMTIPAGKELIVNLTDTFYGQQ